MSIKSIRIGTRGSPLALAQASDVKARLISAHDDLSDQDIEIVVIKTSGDRILDRHLMTAGGKGLFTKEIEEALIDGDIDCAVHSSKDMPTTLPQGLILSTFLPREDIRDAFISPVSERLMDLPENAILGTASLRRRALALRMRPDLQVVTFRGNVQTRLKKLAAGEANATFLAVAGLNRLGMPETITEYLPLDMFPPAPAQGAVTIEIREDDENTRSLLTPLHCSKTALEVTAERSLLKALDGSCRTPIAGYAKLSDDKIDLYACLLSMDGKEIFEEKGSASADLENAAQLGNELGESIRNSAGEAFFQTLKEQIAAEFE
ncbi:hydroxymethylbilane synthase [Kordiimonas sp. SCSIO 12610]|uniref:hydroxymethylbilane synthase n=1 Tax=Kordiimonas sp. SCSIO 12610 TaxID=2829597 RepID=UPI00210C6732|nr:hydroxymethylbilane synthase [Kordiimonas sp. SCSIO 12610]UTW55301.1 hydroxymethylbilane synthase [Kordiimonas sp. SCSIO 12610]